MFLKNWKPIANEIGVIAIVRIKSFTIITACKSLNLQIMEKIICTKININKDENKIYNLFCEIKLIFSIIKLLFFIAINIKENGNIIKVILYLRSLIYFVNQICSIIK